MFFIYNLLHIIFHMNNNAAKVIQDAKPELIEHAAKLVINALFSTFHAIESINITIRKPAIIAQANSVGIRLERHRNDFRPSSGE